MQTILNNGVRFDCSQGQLEFQLDAFLHLREDAASMKGTLTGFGTTWWIFLPDRTYVELIFSEECVAAAS